MKHNEHESDLRITIIEVLLAHLDTECVVDMTKQETYQWKGNACKLSYSVICTHNIIISCSLSYYTTACSHRRQINKSGVESASKYRIGRPKYKEECQIIWRQLVVVCQFADLPPYLGPNICWQHVHSLLPIGRCHSIVLDFHVADKNINFCVRRTAKEWKSNSTHKLIESVQQYESLWNSTCYSYKNRDDKNAAWRAIQLVHTNSNAARIKFPHFRTSSAVPSRCSSRIRHLLAQESHNRRRWEN